MKNSRSSLSQKYLCVLFLSSQTFNLFPDPVQTHFSQVTNISHLYTPDFDCNIQTRRQREDHLMISFDDLQLL